VHRLAATALALETVKDNEEYAVRWLGMCSGTYSNYSARVYSRKLLELGSCCLQTGKELKGKAPRDAGDPG
jgi:hypothetical protein